MRSTNTDIDSQLVKDIAENLRDPKEILDEIFRDRDSSLPPVCQANRATEQWIAELWGEFLGVGQVKTDDSFFGMGGHSLQAAQILARINHHFGIEIPIDMLFSEEFTVGRLAQIVDTMRYSDRPRIEGTARKG